ncbi:hypothetical protein HYPSUDRAFT_598565 [Hypholoma sublateritium FD-334 SS-4]|uniref:Uncharacterized protein n=1 Tax=Hypholoma sublateritium (strain FD-334 SS-4) TaxID=945553 RepID=A0A0D2P3R0_HYPSF|nr:hypothetical protein HYPSUDRAFT_598565 [Hypholoma sublateritium FD-334 SS-4]
MLRLRHIGQETTRGHRARTVRPYVLLFLSFVFRIHADSSSRLLRGMYSWHATQRYFRRAGFDELYPSARCASSARLWDADLCMTRGSGALQLLRRVFRLCILGGGTREPTRRRADARCSAPHAPCVRGRRRPASIRRRKRRLPF